MKQQVRAWIWRFMGYGNGAPLNMADFNRILHEHDQTHHQWIKDSFEQHRGQLQAFMQQMTDQLNRPTLGNIAAQLLAGDPHMGVDRAIELAHELIRKVG